MFNSALIYELSVIKQYAEPLLFSVPKDCDEYYEAKRLLKFLDYFLGFRRIRFYGNLLVVVVSTFKQKEIKSVSQTISRVMSRVIIYLGLTLP